MGNMLMDGLLLPTGSNVTDYHVTAKNTITHNMLMDGLPLLTGSNVCYQHVTARTAITHG